MMPATENNIGRRNCIPILYTRGTHYEVGFDVGRTFAGIIHSFLASSRPLNEIFLPLYETDAGKKVYEETLTCARTNFPQYVKELEGTADGAKVPFNKLFLLHMDEILENVCGQRASVDNGSGCSTVCCNLPGQEILGHTEDALSEVLNHFYFVSAHIFSEAPQGRWKVTEERFTSLCYAGHLPGFTMSYNHHGLVFSVNILSAKKLASGKTPRFFLTRALLAAENFVQAQHILRDNGCGAGDGFSINMTFLQQEGDRLFHNAEVGPAVDGAQQSDLNILTASPGEHIIHCNKYLRLKIPEVTDTIIASSTHRHTAMSKHGEPCTKCDVITLLGDTSDENFPVFRESKDSVVSTIAVGIFDCVERTWSIYSDNPKSNDPIVILPIQLKAPAK